MSDARFIEIKARSRTGQIVTLHVAELLEIDGQPVRSEQQSLLTDILTRLEQLEATIVAIANSEAYSAGHDIASVADELWVTPTGAPETVNMQKLN